MMRSRKAHEMEQMGQVIDSVLVALSTSTTFLHVPDPDAHFNHSLLAPVHLPLVYA